MKKPKKSKKRQYLDSYEKGADGEYVYTGAYYRFDMSPSRIRRMKILYSLLAAAIAAVYGAAGFLDTPGSRTAYVILPYAAMFLPIALMLADVFKIITGKAEMTRKQYDGSVVQLRHVCVAVIILSSLTIIGDAIFIFTKLGHDNIAFEALFSTCCLVILAISFLFYFIQKKVTNINKINR